MNARRALPEMAPAHVRAGAGFAPFEVARSPLMAGFERLLLWQDRASQRRRLSIAEDHMLEDMGLTRTDVDREVRKPFWRA